MNRERGRVSAKSIGGGLRRFFVAVGFVALAVATSASVAFVFARDYLGRVYVAGVPPKGYDRSQEINAAILIGSLNLIDRNPPVPSEIRYEPGVTYARASGRELKLDLYFPPGHRKDRPRPVFVLIHGGGWKSGDRADYRPYAIKVAKAGYVVASLSYRLSGEAKFPAQIRDVNAALRTLAARSVEYGIDPDRFAIMGGSAGGHLAMLAGYASGDPEFRPESDPELEIAGGAQAVNYKIAAVFNFYGPSDLTTEFARSLPVVRQLIGESFDEDAESYRKASPLYRVSAASPPSLVVHGSLDETVPVAQSDILAERLHWVRVPIRYERLFGWPHTMDLAEPMFGYLSDVVLEELKKYVGLPDS